MGYKETYESWVNSSYFDDKTREELRGIAADDQEIACDDLHFDV